jgi:hypothetical protein
MTGNRIPVEVNDVIVWVDAQRRLCAQSTARSAAGRSGVETHVACLVQLRRSAEQFDGKRTSAVEGTGAN